MKRKARSKMSKDKKLNLLFPLTIDQLGTKDDPCFGKLYSIKAAECQRCGDNEFCAIVMGQKNHIKRLAEENKNNYKDLEPIKIPEKKVILSEVRKRILELIKTSKSGINFDELCGDVLGSYSKFGITKEKVERLLKKLKTKYSEIRVKNNIIKWKRLKSPK